MTQPRRVLATVLVVVAVVAVLASIPPAATAPIPQHQDYCPSDARLLDRHGAVLHELRIDPARRRLPWTRLDAISPALIDAVLVSEDRRFIAHRGVDWRAVAAAVWQRLRGGAPRGASTITMQLAALRDASLSPHGAPRTVWTKWRQMRAAWALERVATKDEILEAYLNRVTFRGELQGVAAAAHVLFDKQPHGLTAAESVVLAALLRAPNAERDTLVRRSGDLQVAMAAPPRRAPLAMAT
jgi:penicillin-binding protein 1C